MKRALSPLSTVLLVLGLVFALGALGGCDSNCNRATDCQAGEVCVLGVCRSSEAPYRSCGSDSECNQGASTPLFVCMGGRCLLREVPQPPPDAGGTDAGTDAGTGGDMDAGPDAGN